MRRFWKDLDSPRWFFDGTNPFKLDFARVENPMTLQSGDFEKSGESVSVVSDVLFVDTDANADPSTSPVAAFGLGSDTCDILASKNSTPSAPRDSRIKLLALEYACFTSLCRLNVLFSGSSENGCESRDSGFGDSPGGWSSCDALEISSCLGMLSYDVDPRSAAPKSFTEVDLGRSFEAASCVVSGEALAARDERTVCRS